MGACRGGGARDGLPFMPWHLCHLFIATTATCLACYIPTYKQTVLSFLSYPVEIDDFKLTRNTFVKSTNENLQTVR